MEELIRAGLDVARFNMSHGDHSEHKKRLDETRAASAAMGKTIGLLADLQGPKIRLGNFAEGKVDLAFGQTGLFEAFHQVFSGDRLVTFDLDTGD